MKRQKQVRKAFGMNEFGFIAIPARFSNVQVARMIHCKKECSFDFPHGFDTIKSTIANRQKNWKRFRKTRWKR